jgi:hypothetical protein
MDCTGMKSSYAKQMIRKLLVTGLLILSPWPAYAAIGGISANFSNGVMQLGDGGAACSGTTTSAVRYNSSTHGVQFCNGSAWTSIGGMTFITTRTVSGSASLQITNFPTAFDRLFLNCSNLIASTNTSIHTYIGEGAGPTWETASTYTETDEYSSGESTIQFEAFNNTSDITNNPTISSTIPDSLKLWIDNVTSTTLYKKATYVQMMTYATLVAEVSGSGYWNADKNPVTAIEIVPVSGTLTGTCSLYGMN